MKFIKSLSLLMVVTILTQLFMMYRSMLMAKFYGVNEVMDAYNIANILTISSVSIISAAITTVLIPLLVKKSYLAEEVESINTYVSVLGSISIFMVVLLILFGQPIIKIFTLNHTESMQILTFNLTIILSVSQIFKVMTGISTAFFQTKSDFINPKIANLLAVVISICYFYFNSDPNIYGITIALGLSFFIEIIYLLFKQRKLDFKFKLTFKFHNSTFRLLMKNTGPIILSSAAFQLSVVFSNFIASYFGKGYVSIVGYSNQIVNIIHSLIILNIIMMLYPMIAKKFEENLIEAKKSLIQYINITNLFVIPIVFGFLALGDMIVEVLFQRGSFTSQNTYQVYLISGILFLAFPFNTMRDYIYRCFYSIKDTKTPSRNSILIVLLTILLIAVLAPFIQIFSIAIAPVLASVISLLLSYKKLITKIGKLDNDREILKNNLLFMINSVIMSLMLLIIKHFLEPFKIFTILELILLVVLGGIFYLLLVYLTQKRFLIGIIRHQSKNR